MYDRSLPTASQEAGHGPQRPMLPGGIDTCNAVTAAIRLQLVDELRQVERMLSEDWEANLGTSALMMSGIALKLANEAMLQPFSHNGFKARGAG